MNKFYIEIYPMKYKVTVEGDTATVHNMQDGKLFARMTTEIYKYCAQHHPNVDKCTFKPEVKNEPDKQKVEKAKKVVKKAKPESDLP